MRASDLTPWRVASVGAGLLAYGLIVGLDHGLHHQGSYGARPAYAAACAVLMAIWWLTEAVPIYVTALVPILLYPLTGVFGPDLAANLSGTLLPYVDGYIFLFMGGMGIAAAMQHWNLHRRIALSIMRVVGTDPRRLLFGAVGATAFISMWISNTATAAMMLPIGIAVVRQLEERAGRRLEHYGAAIMLSIAYGANVGGIGTKIGTAPNAQLAQFMALSGVELSFFKFLAVGTPFVLLFLPVVWLLLWRVGRPDAQVQGGIGSRETGAQAVAEELAKLGPVSAGERVVFGVFLATALVWIMGQPITQALKEVWPALKAAHVEGGVAMLAAVALFFLRVGGRRVLAPSALRSQPWETLILLGGSFSMAEGIQKSGLSLWMGGELAGLASLPPFAQVLAASVATVVLSAVASNTATVSVMLNVLKGAVEPGLVNTVLFASTISASCDFALPAGTPPNAIVFAAGYLTVRKMAKTGVVLDLLAALLAAGWCFLAVRLVL